MSIIVNEDTKLVVSGLTGREGTFHGLRNRDYGTDLVAGVTPARAARTSRGCRCSTRSARPSTSAARTPR